MATKVRKSKQLDSATTEFLIARYTSIRDEIQHRDTNNYQLISLHLTIAAAILTFGLQPNSVASVLFIIPITSALLGLLATHNLLTRGRLKTVIKNDIEAVLIVTNKDTVPQKSFVSDFLGVAGASGVFFAVEILAFILGLIKIQHYTTLDLVLIIADILALFITLLLIFAVLRARKNE